MSFPSYTERSREIFLSAWWNGRDRSLRISPGLGFAFAILFALAAAWSLAATAYVVCHGRILASLLARQADMQYSYEDRIVALKAMLDRETSRDVVDRQTLETTIRDLGERGAKLEARAATIDALVVHG